MQRICGQSLGDFFRTEIALPLQLDLYLGLPPQLEDRVAPIIRADPTPLGEVLPISERVAAQDPGSIPAQAFLNSGRRTGARDYDSAEAHQAVLPSGGAIGNARGLARMYMPLALGGAAAGVHLVDASTIAEMSAQSAATAIDAVLLIPTRFSLGYWKRIDNRAGRPGEQDSVLIPESAFGHPGMGGS